MVTSDGESYAAVCGGGVAVDDGRERPTRTELPKKRERGRLKRAFCANKLLRNQARISARLSRLLLSLRTKE
jgi:hypothetical protein